MNDRLTQFLTAEQLSPARFADLLGVARAGVSHILAGRNKPGVDFLEKFLKRFPAVNIEWFITGHGKMYKERSMPPLFPADTVADPAAAAAVTAETPAMPGTPYDTASNTMPAATAALRESALPPPVSAAAAAGAAQTVDRVLIFFSDKTVQIYTPRGN